MVNQMTQEKIEIPKTGRWCLMCGRHVDMRRKGANAMHELVAKNPEYRYVCGNVCFEEFKVQNGLK